MFTILDSKDINDGVQFVSELGTMNGLSLLSSENKINALIPINTHIDKTTKAVKTQVNNSQKIIQI